MTNNQETPQNKQIFYCAGCRYRKQGQLTLIKVSANDKEYNLIRGQEYSFCSTCSPKIKPLNEYDLLNENPQLWDKYPYSDAKEILEKEFGIKLKDHE